MLAEKKSLSIYCFDVSATQHYKLESISIMSSKEKTVKME